MANEEHLAILKQGVETWNQWRGDNPEIRLDLIRADLSDAHLSLVDLSYAHLSRADLSRADLSGAHLSHADLSRADLSRADLSYADLSYADLSDADLSFAHLSLVDLSHALLSGVHLSHADLSDAHLSRALLVYADLSRADLTGTNMSDAKIGWTVFGDVDLRKVKGLDTVWHQGPSTIGVDTIYNSKGNIPHKFLLDSGMPQEAIDYLLPLAGKAIDFYSCFISYSSKDQDFAERLHADLQAKGVRCWFAPEDLKIGEPILAGIDKGIRLHDKLLLVLSAHSVASRWVEHEVESALAEELRPDRKTKVLFPIRLDNAVMDAKVDWAYRIRQRHIGDFTHWKDHDAYQRAFERLLRDLKAQG